MARFFNTTGPCNPAWHYMLPPEVRLPLVRPLIAQQLYFTVHAARQSGKTTSFLAFARALTAEGRYAALHAS
ncbi:MAG: ATP-binding protein, partial [Deltaproteobacteria bacterium]|nr:ATP-binding protein [Deltaproteobacteria bacterium]